MWNHRLAAVSIVGLDTFVSLFLNFPASAGVVQSKQNDLFFDSIGVNTHFLYSGTPYNTNFDTINTRLRNLGIRHVRDGVSTNQVPFDAGKNNGNFPSGIIQSFFSRCNTIANRNASGVPETRFTLAQGISMSPDYNERGMSDAIANCGNAIEAFEAYNEPDLTQNSTSTDPSVNPENKICFDQHIPWDQCTGTVGIPSIYNRARTLGNIPVLAPALGNSLDGANRLINFFNPSNYVPGFIGNIHNYTGNGYPELSKFDDRIFYLNANGTRGCTELAYPPASYTGTYARGTIDYEINCVGRVVAGSQVKIYMTEAGFNNVNDGTTSDQNGFHLPFDVTSRYLPRLLLNSFNKGIDRTFLYEFADSGTNKNIVNDNWGLLNNDGSPKPAFYAVSSLNKLKESTTSFTPDALNYSITVNPSSAASDCPNSGVDTLFYFDQARNSDLQPRYSVVQQTVLQSSSRDFYVVMWLGMPAFKRGDLDGNPPSVYLNQNPTNLTQSCTVPVTITFSPQVKSFTVGYQWLSNGNATNTGTTQILPPSINLVNGKLNLRLSDTALLLRLNTVQTAPGQSANPTASKETTFVPTARITNASINKSSGADAIQWDFCGFENETCQVEPGATPRFIRYGVNGSYVISPINNNIIPACNNTSFGRDPVPGARKQCQLLRNRVDTTGTPVGASAGKWEVCAAENSACQPKPGTQPTLIRYGAPNGNYIVKSIVNNVIPACNNATFSDPAMGAFKRCELFNNSVVWNYCATEGGTCTFEPGSMPTRIRFGANGVYNVFAVSNMGSNINNGNLPCTATYFAQPLSGVTKQCEYQ